MKQQIKISIIATSMIFALVGCGSDSEDIPNEDENKVENVNNHVGEVTRIIGEEFVAPVGLETKDNKEGLKITKDGTDYYIAFSYDDTTKNIQFFIDTDNNSDTGSVAEGGADLIVENGQLYIPEGEKGAIWKKYTGDKAHIAYNASEKEDSIKFSKELIQNDYFGVKVQLLDASWMPQVTSPAVLPKSYFDVNMSSYETLVAEETYIENSYNNFSLKLNDDNSADIDMLFSGDQFRKYTQIFIDSDNDNATGFIPKIESDQTLLWSNMGVDYMIEDGKLYGHDSENTQWPWKYERDVPHLIAEEEQKSIRFNLQKSSFANLADSIKVAVSTNDLNWENFHAVPEVNASTEIPEYSLNK